MRKYLVTVNEKLTQEIEADRVTRETADHIVVFWQGAQIVGQFRTWQAYWAVS